MAQTLEKILRPDENDATTTVKSYLSIVLDSPPSCLEFAPSSAAYPHHFVVGTYSLDTSQNVDNERRDSVQTRTGSLQLFSLKGDNLLLLNTYVTPYAVLDLHFSPKDDDNFAVATSIGVIDLYRVQEFYEIKKVRTFQICDPSILVLALAWSPKVSNSNWDPAIGLSLSSGQVGYVSFADSEQLMRLAKPHSMEVWTIAWSNMENENHSWLYLYSGADDSVFCKNGDMQGQSGRNEEGSFLQLPLEPLSRDTKTHKMGVTAILPLSIREDDNEWVILTGSYDEYVRVLTLADNSGRSKLLADKRVYGGGVWRLKLLGYRYEEDEIRIEVLASCMHAGVRLLQICRLSNGTWSVRIAAKFVEHGSMNYASDARKGMQEGKPGMTVVSTSFYDRKLCVWNVEET